MPSRKNWASRPVVTPIEVEVDGEQHAGAYSVEDGFVRVTHRASGLRKETKRGSSEPLMIARLLLIELVGEYRERRAEFE